MAAGGRWRCGWLVYARLLGLPLPALPYAAATPPVPVLPPQGYCLYRLPVAAAAMRAARAAGARVSIDLASFEVVERCWTALDSLLQVRCCGAGQPAAGALLRRSLRRGAWAGCAPAWRAQRVRSSRQPMLQQAARDSQQVAGQS